MASPFALLSALLFGASTPLAKMLLGSVDPWMMAGLLYLGAGIGLAFIHAGRPLLSLPNVEAPLRRADLPWLAIAILAGGVAGPLFLMFGLSISDAATASLLLNLEGLATMAIAWVVFRESVDHRLIIGAFAILTGAAVLSWDGHATLQWGAILVASACVCWGIDNNITRKISSSDPVQIAMIKGVVAGAINLTIAITNGSSLPSPVTILVVCAIGFLGFGVSLALFVLALRHLGTARTGAYFSLAPFVGASLALIALSEPVTANLMIAGLLMAFGLWLHLTEHHAHRHNHDPMEHEHAHVHDEHHQHGHDHQGVDPTQSHSHWHRHSAMTHRHAHYPDIHHRHDHA